MITSKRLSLAAILLFSPALSFAGIVVSHYESLQDTRVSNERSDSMSLQFDALGRRFDLELVTNDRITAGLDPAIAASSIGVYRGRLAGKPNSWARIVMYAGQPSGVIWDGTEMFAIEAPGDSSLLADSAVVYRLADAHIVPGTMSCGSDALSGNAGTVLKGMLAASKTAIARGPGAVSEITMTAIGDFEFTTAQGGDIAANAAITTRLNNVDGYFSEQVGVQLNLELVETHSNPNDPFGDTIEPDELLDELSLYREQSAVHNSRGLTHLYTGRNFSTNTVGIAWRGVLCESYFGAGLSEGRTGALNDSLIAAHEIGHNFNAEHDGEAGTPCEADTAPYIMSPSINGSQQFSDCSIGIMQAHAASASCVVALPTFDVSVTPVGQSANILLGADTDFEYEISSNGTLTVSAVTADFTLPSTLTLNAVSTTIGSCTSGAGVVSCDLGDLVGLSSNTIILSTTPSSTGAGTVTAAVSTTDPDERPSNNQDALLLTVDPAVDLGVSTPSTAAVFINDSATVNATLNNFSTLDATNVTLSISLESGIQATAASWSIGTCTVAAQQIDCQANTFLAQTASTLSVTATGITNGDKDVTVVLASAEAEANPGDNSATGVIRVTSRNEDKDDGGGATAPFWLLTLLTMGILCRRNFFRL